MFTGKGVACFVLSFFCIASSATPMVESPTEYLTFRIWNPQIMDVGLRRTFLANSNAIYYEVSEPVHCYKDHSTIQFFSTGGTAYSISINGNGTNYYASPNYTMDFQQRIIDFPIGTYTITFDARATDGSKWSTQRTLIVDTQPDFAGFVLSDGSVMIRLLNNGFPTTNSNLNPILISNGFDPDNQITPIEVEQILSRAPSTGARSAMDVARNHQRTVWFVEYSGGAASIRHNAQIYREACRTIYSQVQPADNIIAAGYSMGGLIVRCALAEAEYGTPQNPPENLHVEKFVSMDSPQHGAYLNTDLQSFMCKNDEASKGKLLSDAAREMLFGSMDPQSITASSATFEAFQNFLYSLPNHGYPAGTTNYAISLGAQTENFLLPPNPNLATLAVLGIPTKTISYARRDLMPGSVLTEGITAAKYLLAGTVTFKFNFAPTFIPTSSSLGILQADIADGVLSNIHPLERTFQVADFEQHSFFDKIYPSNQTSNRHDVLSEDFIQALDAILSDNDFDLCIRQRDVQFVPTGIAVKVHNSGLATTPTSASITVTHFRNGVKLSDATQTIDVLAKHLSQTILFPISISEYRFIEGTDEVSVSVSGGTSETYLSNNTVRINSGFPQPAPSLLAYPGPRRISLHVSLASPNFDNMQVYRSTNGENGNFSPVSMSINGQIYNTIPSSLMSFDPGTQRCWFPFLGDEDLAELDADGHPITYTYRVKFNLNVTSTPFSPPSGIAPGIYVYRKTNPANPGVEWSRYITFMSNSDIRYLTKVEDALSIVNDFRTAGDHARRVVYVTKGKFDVSPYGANVPFIYVPSNTDFRGLGSLIPGVMACTLSVKNPFMLGSGTTGGTSVRGFLIDGNGISNLLTLVEGPLVPTIVEHNVFTNCAGDAIQIFPCLSTSSANSVVRMNTIVRNGGSGIRLIWTDTPINSTLSPTITQNIIVSNSYHGIQQPTNTSTIVAQPMVAFNDIWDNHAGNVRIGNTSYASANNIAGYSRYGQNISADPGFAYGRQSNGEIAYLYSILPTLPSGENQAFKYNMGAFGNQLMFQILSPVDVAIVTDKGDTLSETTNQIGPDARFEYSTFNYPASNITLSGSGTTERQIGRSSLQYAAQSRNALDATKLLIINNPILRPGAYTLVIKPSAGAGPKDTYSMSMTLSGLNIPLATNKPVPATEEIVAAPFDPALFTYVPPDTVPPATPKNFIVQINGNDVFLSWSPNGETDLAGYKILRSDRSPVSVSDSNQIEFVDKTGTSFHDSGAAGSAKFYAIAAIDANGNESSTAETSPSVYIFVDDQGSDKTGNGTQAAPYATIDRASKELHRYPAKPISIAILPGSYVERVNINFPCNNLPRNLSIKARYDAVDSMPQWFGDRQACLELQNQNRVEIRGIRFAGIPPKGKGRSQKDNFTCQAIWVHGNIASVVLDRCYFLGKRESGLSEGIRIDGRLVSASISNCIFQNVGTAIDNNTNDVGMNILGFRFGQSDGPKLGVVNSTFYQCGFVAYLTGKNTSVKNERFVFDNNIVMNPKSGFVFSVFKQARTNLTFRNSVFYGQKAIIKQYRGTLTFVDTLMRDPLFASTDSIRFADPAFMRPTLAEVVTGGLIGSSVPTTDFAGNLRGNLVSMGAVEGNSGATQIPIAKREAGSNTERMQTIDRFAVMQNYPNPFNPITSIRFQIPGLIGKDLVHVSLEIFDAQGRVVRTLINESRTAGRYSIAWNGRSDRGNTVPTGMYFYRLRAGQFGAMKRMLLLK